MSSINKLYIVALAIGITTLTTCNEKTEVQHEYPLVNTVEVTNISEKGATVVGHIISVGDDEIIDHGFVWGRSVQSLNINTGDRISFGSLTGKGNFEFNISTTLEVKKEYFVRTFVKTANHVVYGQVLSFMSLGSEAPTVTSFEPKTAGWGDTITIKGQNFSHVLNSNKVYFNSLLAKSLSANDSTIKAIVPINLNTFINTISVEIAGNKAKCEQDTFKLIPPTIIDFKPKEAYWGDTIVVYGKNLNQIIDYPSINSLKINSTLCANFIISTKDSISFIVPDNITPSSYQIVAQINSITVNSANKINILPPYISDFKPRAATWGDKITLYGKFSSKHPYTNAFASNKVYFNNELATFILMSHDSLIVQVPTNLGSTLSTIKYIVNGTTVVAQNKFQLLAPVINSFSPTVVPPKSFITIYGKNFGPNTSIYFGNSLGSPLTINNTNISVVVPKLPDGSYKIRMTVGDQEVTAEQNITIINPVMHSIEPTTGTFGDTITVRGANFNESGNNDVVINNGKNYPAEVIYNSSSLLKFKIPNELTSTPGFVNVFVNNNYGYNQIISVETITLNAPIINSFSPTSGISGQEVTIYGNNFNPTPEFNIVNFGYVKVKVLSASRTELKVKIDNLPLGNHKVKLTMNGFTTEASQLFNCVSSTTTNQ